MKTFLSLSNSNFDSSLFSPWRLRLIVISLLFSICFTSITFAQVSKEWDKDFGQEGAENTLWFLLATPDGGNLVGKSFRWGTGSSHYYSITKIDAAGNTIWDKRLFVTPYSVPLAATAIPSGGYLLGSRLLTPTDAGCEFDCEYTESNYVIRLDANGNQIWDKAYNVSGDFSYLTVTTDGSYLLAGTSRSRSTGIQHWVTKIDQTGNQIWSKSYGTNTSFSGDEFMGGLAAAPDGGALLGMTTNAGISGHKNETSKGGTDYWVLKINSNGDKVWDKSFGGSSLDGLEALVTTTDGGYILGGTSQSGVSGNKTAPSRGGTDYWLVKIDGTGTKVWDKAFGGNSADNATALVATNDGHFVVGGSSSSPISGDKTEASQGSDDYWIVKLNTNGNKIWDKRFGGSEPDYLTHLAAANGSYVLGGRSFSGISGDKSQSLPNEYPENIWLVKAKENIPPALTVAWNFRYGGSGTDRFPQTISTTDGGYLVAGSSNSPVSGDKTVAGYGDYDIWVVKTSADGTKLWNKRFGGTGREAVNSVIQTSDGGYLLGGSSESGISGNKTQASQGSMDYWLIKISSTGSIQWNKRFGGSGYDYLNKVIQLNTGDYVVAGVSNSPISGDKTQDSRGGNDLWVLKLTGNGTKIWDKRFGGSLNEYVEGLVKIPEGGYLVGGYSNSGISGDKTQASQGGYDYWAVKVSPAGDKVWDKRFGGAADDRLAALIRTADGNYLLGGSSASAVSGNKTQPSQGGIDYWVVKINGSGTKLWDERYGGTAADQLTAMMQTTDGGYLLGGSSASGTGGEKTQASRGSTDFWLVKIAGNSTKQWDQRFGGSGTEDLRTISATKDGGYLLGGHSTSGVSGDKTQPSQGGTDYWLVKVAPVTAILAANSARVNIPSATITEAISSINLSAFPNPFSEVVTISFTLPQTQTAALKLYDGQGREVSTLYRGQAEANIPQQVQWQPKTEQAAGLYIIRLQTPNRIETRKVLLTR